MELDLDKKNPLTYRWWEEAGWAIIILALSLLIGLGIGEGAILLTNTPTLYVTVSG